MLTFCFSQQSRVEFTVAIRIEVHEKLLATTSNGKIVCMAANKYINNGLSSIRKFFLFWISPVPCYLL